MPQATHDTGRIPILARFRRSAGHALRLAIGIVFIALGFLGVILPVLPGMPFFLIASLIIGRRSRLLRRGSVAGKRALRRWSTHEHRLIARLARWSLNAQRDTSRHLRRINWWLADRQQSVRQRFLRA